MSMTNSINEKGIIELEDTIIQSKEQKLENGKSEECLQELLVPPTKEIHAL